MLHASSVLEGSKDTAEVKGLNWHHIFSFVNAFSV